MNTIPNNSKIYNSKIYNSKSYYQHKDNFKRLIFSLVLIVMGLISYTTQNAQAQQQTLFSGETNYSGYGALDLKGTTIAGQNSMLIGGHGGLLINNTFAIGLGGYGSVIRHTAPYSLVTPNPFNNSRNLVLDMGYGGFVFEYINNSDDLLHFNANVLLGGGGASHSSFRGVYNEMDRWNDVPSPCTFFWVVEPSVNLELNVTSFMRVGAGVSYRYVQGTNWDNLNTINDPSLLPTSKDLSGLAGQLTFKFGGF